MEYLNGLKNYIPGLKNKGYKKMIQLDSNSTNKTPVVGVFVNPENNYLVSCTQNRLEVFDLKDGNRVSAN